MKIAMCKSSFIISFIFFIATMPLVAFGRPLTLSGIVGNLSYSSPGKNMRVYLPGFPFVGNDPAKEWMMLGDTTYDATTGAYSIILDVPVDATNLIIAASYGDGHTDVTKSIAIAGKTSVLVDLLLANPTESDLSFRFRIFYADIEFDYNKTYSCLVASSVLVPDGRIVLFSALDALIYNNTAYNLPPQEYRVACSVKNLDGGTPRVLRRVITMKLPLANAQGVPLPESERVIELRFGGSSENGTVF